MRFTDCLLSLILLAITQAAAPAGVANGSISGIVSSRTGEPLKGIKIDASPADGRPLGRAMRFVETDSLGRYELDNLDFGSYNVFAQNESMGYPNAHLDFYRENAPPRVMLDEKHPRAQINIIMSTIAGCISGTVLDRVTSKPIENATIKLSKRDAAGWITTAFPSKKSLLVPADIPFVAEVTAAGYREWKGQAPIVVRSGQELSLDVVLEPIQDQPKH